jgi:hypothetical protein
MTRKLSRGEFSARQKADAWAHAQNPELANREREARQVRETAQTLIEDRGAINALAWAAHCATRDASGFWRKVCNAIDGVQAAAMLAGKRD